jgi:hypothetical protein
LLFALRFFSFLIVFGLFVLISRPHEVSWRLQLLFLFVDLLSQ